MRDPSISLIIPAYNEEKNIGKCLEAVFQNNGGITEIIVVDNASTDTTAEVAKKFSGVKVIREENKGVMYARQRGYLESTGDLVAFIDADCRITPGWKKKVENAFKDDNLTCLSGPYKYYDLSRFQNFLASIYWREVVVVIHWIFGYVGNFGNMILKREVLQKMNGLDTSIKFYGDDTDTTRRAKQFGKVRFDRDLVIESSGRRFLKEGLFRSTFLYVLNFWSEAIFHKPATKSYKDLR